MTSHLISTLGADILAVFLFVAGLILVTGAGLAGVVRATGAGVAGHHARDPALDRGLAATRARRPPPAAARARVAGRLRPSRSRPLGARRAVAAPEPDTSELVVRATHVEAPPIFEDRSTTRTCRSIGRRVARRQSRLGRSRVARAGP